MSQPRARRTVNSQGRVPLACWRYSRASPNGAAVVAPLGLRVSIAPAGLPESAFRFPGAARPWLLVCAPLGLGWEVVWLLPCWGLVQHRATAASGGTARKKGQIATETAFSRQTHFAFQKGTGPCFRPSSVRSGTPSGRKMDQSPAARESTPADGLSARPRGNRQTVPPAGWSRPRCGLCR